MIQLRPNQADLLRLKEPFGKLLQGDPSKTMPELNMLVRRNHPSRVTAVGGAGSQTTFCAGIPVGLGIIRSGEQTAELPSQTKRIWRLFLCKKKTPSRRV